MPGRSTQRICTLLAAAVGTAMLATSASAADLYRWIDAAGIARFTTDPDRVPSVRRSTLVKVEPGMAAAPAPAPQPAEEKPATIPAPPGDPVLADDPFEEPERAREVESTDVEPLAPSEAASPEAPAAGAASAPLAAVEAGPPAKAPEPGATAGATPSGAPPAAGAAAAKSTNATGSASAPAVPAARRTTAPTRVPADGRRAPGPPREDGAVSAAKAADAWGEVVVIGDEAPAPKPSAPSPGTPAPSAKPPASSTPPPAAPAEATPPVSAPPPAAAGLRVEETTPGLFAVTEVAAASEPDGEGAPAASAAAGGATGSAALTANAARIAELKAAIARDEETLKEMLSANPDAPLAPTPELRAIAERLPGLQAELRALEAQGEAP